MKFTERKEKLEYLLYLIEKGRLISTQIVANNCGCSRRTVERMINLLKEEGYNIKYSKSAGKYYLKK